MAQLGWSQLLTIGTKGAPILFTLGAGVTTAISNVKATLNNNFYAIYGQLLQYSGECNSSKFN